LVDAHICADGSRGQLLSMLTLVIDKELGDDACST